MQALVTETMRSVLSGKERRRLELYEHDKNTIMYRRMLMNVGAQEIAQQMRELHIKATLAMHEEEKQAKRQMALNTEVNSSVGNRSNKSATPVNQNVSMPAGKKNAEFIEAMDLCMAVERTDEDETWHGKHKPIYMQEDGPARAITE